MIAGDTDIIKQFANYTFLNSEHLTNLTNRPIVSIRRRLRKLHEEGLLQGVEVPFEPAVHFLTRKGANIAASLGFQDEPSWVDSKSPLTIEHDVQITKFHLDIAAKLDLIFWEQRRGELQDHAGELSVNPDALFGIRRGELSYYFFLEVEQGKETDYVRGESSRMKKVRAYFEYANAKKHIETWGIQNFRVIFLLPTWQRAKNFRDKVAEQFPFRRFWITSMDYQDILGKIFLNPKDETLHSFLD
jgi:hypothetical protein